MAKVTKNYPKLNTTNRILFEDKTILAHIKDSNIHLTKEEKEMIDNILENGFIPGSGSGSSEIDWDKINELLKEKADVNHTHSYTSEDIEETDDKRFVSNQDIEKWNNIIENIEPDHIHNNISVLDKIAEDSEGNPLYDGKALKGRDGKDGDSGVFVGNVNDAPPSADIVIDNSDKGLYINESVITPIKNSTLNLTLNKNQTTTMKNNTTIVLPVVDRFTEIHLFFSTTEELTLVLPNIKWNNQVNIEANKTYEFIFTYTDSWLGGCVVYV